MPQTQDISSENLDRFIALPADKRRQVFDHMTPDAQQAVIAAIQARGRGQQTKVPVGTPYGDTGYTVEQLTGSTDPFARRRYTGKEIMSGIGRDLLNLSGYGQTVESARAGRYGEAAKQAILPTALWAVGGKLEELAGKKLAERAMTEAAGAELPEARRLISGAPKWGKPAERFDYVLRRLGRSAQESLRGVQTRARQAAGQLFERATTAIDQQFPQGITSAAELRGSIERVIQGEAGSPELETQVRAALPKGIRELLKGEPSELEQANVFRGRRSTGFTGKVASDIPALAKRLESSGMSQGEVRETLQDLGYSARDIVASLGKVVRTAKGEEGVAARRLNEIQREVGEVAFGRETPVVARVLGQIYDSLGKRLQVAAEQSNVGELWSRANSEWVHYVETFRGKGPIAEATRAKVGTDAITKLVGKGEQFAREQLERYAARGDKDVSRLLASIEHAKRIQNYLHISRWGRLAYIFPVLQAMRRPESAGQAGKEELGMYAGLALLRRVLGSLALRGLP